MASCVKILLILLLDHVVQIIYPAEFRSHEIDCKVSSADYCATATVCGA